MALAARWIRHRRAGRGAVGICCFARRSRNSLMTFAHAATLSDDQRRRLSIGFNNFAHAVDHYVMLIFPTVVIGLEVVYARNYSELIALATASFVAFGVFSLPAGWLG